MGRKKNLKGIDESDIELIESKMGYVERAIDNNILPQKVFDYKVNIKCKNKKQKDFLNILKDKEKIICFGIGSAGSGKSYISLSYALQALKDEETPFKKIICLVPTCQAGAMNLRIFKRYIRRKNRTISGS